MAVTGKARLHGMDKDNHLKTEQPHGLTEEDLAEARRLASIQLSKEA